MFNKKLNITEDILRICLKYPIIKITGSLHKNIIFSNNISVTTIIYNTINIFDLCDVSIKYNNILISEENRVKLSNKTKRLLRKRIKEYIKTLN